MKYRRLPLWGMTGLITLCCIINFLTVAAKILLTSKTKLAEEKQNVTVVCTATGQPQPDIAWFKADGALPPGRNGVTVDGALTIFNVGKKGRETYVCKAENILGAVSDTTQLMVFSPLRFKMNLPQGVTPALFGSTVCLPCVVESDLKTTIIWSKNGRSSLPVDAIVLQNNTLVLENFRESHDESYSCVATGVH